MLHLDNRLPNLQSLCVSFQPQLTDRIFHFRYVDEQEPWYGDTRAMLRAMCRLRLRKMEIEGLRSEDLTDSIKERVEFQSEYELDRCIPSWFFSEERLL